MTIAEQRTDDAATPALTVEPQAATIGTEVSGVDVCAKPCETNRRRSR
jgi:hypothetical protein